MSAESIWEVMTMKIFEGYVFRHKADQELYDLCSAFKAGRISEADVRERLKKYSRWVDVADFEGASIDASGKDVFWFPFDCEDSAFRPATSEFEQWASSLGIPGMYMDPDGGDWYLVVQTDEALEQLRKQAEGKYKIVDGFW